MPSVPGPATSVVLAEGPWTHRDVAANGARFHVATLGEDDAPLVLLVHGFPQFWWTWRHQMPRLAKAGYRVAAMDLRGYGGSDKPPRGYDPFTLVRDIAGVVRSLGAPDAVIVGQDWGGLLGWVTAVLEPKVVRGLVSVGMPHPRRLAVAHVTDRRQLAASNYVLGFQRPWLPERALARDNAELVERLLQAWAAPGWPDIETAGTYREAFSVPYVAHCALEYYRWTVRSTARPDGRRFMRVMKRPVTAPVLLVHGELDRCVLASSCAGSGDYVAGSYRLEVLAGVGHFPQEEAPDRVSDLLIDWLEREHG